MLREVSINGNVSSLRTDSGYLYGSCGRRRGGVRVVVAGEKKPDHNLLANLHVGQAWAHGLSIHLLIIQ